MKIQEIQFISSIPFYILILFIIILIINKINKPGYFLSLIKNVSLEKNKFQTNTVALHGGSINLPMQVSYVLLLSCGIWLYTSQIELNISYNLVLLGSSVFYLIQTVTFFSFSYLIGDREKLFFQHRLIQNELISILFFPIILIFAYTDLDFTYLFPACIALFSLLSWIRTCMFLEKFVSGFHIILYLCTLELIPFLFLLKFVLTI